MTERNYKIAQIGWGKFLYSVFGVMICLSLMLLFKLQLSPKSVGVSGYSRKDGTIVGSYNRRSSGMARRDAPYEILTFIFMIGAIGNGIWLYSLRKKYLQLDINIKFHSNISYQFNYPKIGYSNIRVPTGVVTPRKKWACDICGKKILTGSKFFYYDDESQSKRSHICEVCKEILAYSQNINSEKKLIYDEEFNYVQIKREEQFKREFTSLFGKEPIGNIAQIVKSSQ
jgi:hypothetical protein